MSVHSDIKDRIVHLSLEGYNDIAIAMMLDVSERSVALWRNERGIQSVRERSRYFEGEFRPHKPYVCIETDKNGSVINQRLAPRPTDG